MITIPAHLRDGLIAHAQREAPRECCGILAGVDGAVDTVYLCRNVASKPDRDYRVDTRDQRAAFQSIVDRGKELLGFYHSHPASGTALSMSDRAHAYYHDVAIVIVSLASDPPDIAIHAMETDG
jgi:proteasome lid subunit RPN8/RPN11